MDKEAVVVALQNIRSAADDICNMESVGYGRLRFQKVRTLTLLFFTTRANSGKKESEKIVRCVRSFLSGLNGEEPEKVQALRLDHLRQRLSLRLDPLMLVSDGNNSFHLFREAKDLCHALSHVATNEIGDRMPTRLGNKLRLVHSRH
jgi:hypothetical protein